MDAQNKTTPIGPVSEGEEKYRSIFNNSLMGIYQSTPEGRYITANQAFASIFGYDSPEDMMHVVTNIAQDMYINPEDRQKCLQQLRDKGVAVFELPCKRKDGSTLWVMNHVRVVTDIHGHVDYYDGIICDITELKRLEEFLNKSVQKFTTAFLRNSIPTAITTVKEGRYVDVSDSFLELNGLKREEVVGKTSIGIGFITAEQRSILINELHRYGYVKNLETAIRTGDGEIHHVLFNSTQFCLEGEDLLVTMITDITDRKQAEDALRESEVRFRRLHEASFGGIMIHDKGVILEANQGLALLSGYALPELIGMNGLQLISPECRDLFTKNVETNDEKPFEIVGVKKNESIYHAEIQGKSIPYHGKQVMVAEFRDISERKKMEEILRKTLDQLEFRVLERTNELQEANTALRVLLNQRMDDQRGLAERLQMNINELVIPIINELRLESVNDRCLRYLNLLEANLKDISSPFLSTLVSAFRNLTPKEIQVASMIHEGKQTKQIAEFMGVSTSTIDTHRDNIRAKLGLKKAKSNLRSYLLSMK